MKIARRVALTALACMLPQVLIACNEQPSPPPIGAADMRAVKADPFDAGAGAGKSAPVADAAPAKPAVTEAELRIPFYPGATPFVESGNARASSTAGKGITATLLQTGDSMDKVVAFYQEKLTGPDETGKPAPPSRRNDQLDGKPTVTLSRIDGRTIRAAVMRQNNGLIIIELMTMDAPMPVRTGAASTDSPTLPGGTTTLDTTGTTSSEPPFSGMSGTSTTPPPNTQTPKRSLPYP